MSRGHSRSRREFLGRAASVTLTAGMTAASYGRTLGANDRIRIGQIGCGNRGFGAHMAAVHKYARQENLEIVAVCDVWKPHLERATVKVREWFGRAPRATTKYEEVLAMEEIDAVMIASPDHQHCLHLEAAAKAGKDAYCEKPLAMNMEELRSACDAVEAAGVVVQIGTQSRSDPKIVGCKTFYQSGMLGKVHRIEQYYTRNRPNWYIRVTRLPIKKSELDWAEFLKPKPYRPFNDVLFAGWYGYREFCSGSIGQFMSHFSDLVHFVTGARFPTSAVAAGDTFVWKDKYKFDCPEQVDTSLIYPEGFMVHFCANLCNSYGRRTMAYGTQGILDLAKGKASGAGAYQRGTLGDEVAVEPVECPDHFRNWFQCLRSRRLPVAPIEAGYQHAVACILADRAWETGRRQVFDRQKGEIREGIGRA